MKIFKNQIVKIVSHEKRRDLYYSIHDEKVRVGFLKKETKKVISNFLWMGEFKILEDYKLSEENFIENDTVFLKPHCILYLSNNSKVTKYFKTKEELKSFVDELTKDCKILDL